MPGPERASTGAPLPTVDVYGVPFNDITEMQCVAWIMRQLELGRGGWVVTPNLDILRLMSGDPELTRLVRKADLLVADGMPIVWASRGLGRPLPERVAGSSLVSTLSAAADRNHRSIYLLGGDPGTADGAARELGRRHPSLMIAGTDCPERGFESDPLKLADIVERLRRAAPDVVYVALGFPKQERLIERLRGEFPATWFLGVGISFSYLCGRVTRAPAWMRASGLEWLHRLAQEPGRLADRYLRRDLPFGLRLAAHVCAARGREVGNAKTADGP